jgi:hypothetical protein
MGSGIAESGILDSYVFLEEGEAIMKRTHGASVVSLVVARAGAAATLLTLAAACSSSPSTPSIYNTWIYTNADGTAGEGLTVKSNGTYVLQLLTLTSTSSAEDEAQTGTIVVGASTLAFTPQKWSCSGPYPAFTWTYTFDGDFLDVDTGTNVVSFSADTSSASNFDDEIGCFGANGTFTESPLAPIK